MLAPYFLITSPRMTFRASVIEGATEVHVGHMTLAKAHPSCVSHKNAVSCLEMFHVILVFVLDIHVLCDSPKIVGRHVKYEFCYLFGLIIYVQSGKLAFE
jgi:hypothetical protein